VPTDVSFPSDLQVDDNPQKSTDGEIKESCAEVIRFLKQESKRARLPREVEWNKAWNLNNGFYDFLNKAEWQSKTFLPRINTSVRAACYMFKRGLTPNARDFFDTKGYGDIGKKIAEPVKKTTSYFLNQGQMVNNYITALYSGMLTGLVAMKVYPKYQEVDELPDEYNKGGPAPGDAPRNNVGSIFSKPKRKKLTIQYDPLSVFDVYLDPYGDNMYVLHEMEMDYWRFKELCQSGKNGWKDISNVLEEEYVVFERQAREASEKGQNVTSYSPNYRRRVTVLEMWGDLPDQRGNLAFKNCYAVMVNDKYMAVDPRPNPYPNGVRPFVFAPMVERPFSTWHQSLVESVTGIQILLTELLNLIMDASLYASVHAFEVDLDQVFDPTEFKDGVFPGKVFKKRANGQPNAPLIKDLTLGQMPPELSTIYQMLSAEYGGNFGMPDNSVVQSGGQRKGKQSAAEASARQQSASDFMQEIAHTQEEKCIEPMLDLTYVYLLNYLRDFNDPTLKEVVGDEALIHMAAYLSNKEMRQFLSSNPVKFKSFGMYSVTQRQKELEKVMAFLNVVGSTAKVIPQLLQTVNFKGILEIAVDALNWDQSKIFNEPQPGVASGAPAGIPTPVPAGPQGAAQGVPKPPTQSIPDMSQVAAGGAGPSAMQVV
jgi:hypothetical protein